MRIQDTLKKRANNFTLLRLLAALAVLYGHSYDLSQGKPGSDPITHHLIYPAWGDSLPGLAVALFFVTSGFLVTASYIQRQSLVAFIEARVLRIYPGLIVATLFCVFIVGSFVTTESVASYISSPTTWAYIKHNSLLVTGVQYDLPSVFLNNPYPGSVNGSLWTLPIELLMYFWIAALGSLGLLISEKAFNAIVIILCLMYAQSPASFFIASNPTNAHLALLFLLGGFFYINRNKIPLGLIGFGMLCAIVYLTTEYRFSGFLKEICFAYTVLLLALHPKLRLPSIDRWGDISYGIYIYAFPMQQTLAYLIPQITPSSMFILSTAITIPLSIFSWKFIEKPALTLKRKISFRTLTNNDILTK